MKWNNKFIYPKSTRSIVNGSRHYSIENSNLPSVTAILSATKSEEDKAALAAWKERVGHKEAERIKNDASRRGTSMHTYLESFLLNKFNLELIEEDNKAKKMAEEIIDNGLKKNLSEVWGAEATLYYPGKLNLSSGDTLKHFFSHCYFFCYQKCPVWSTHLPLGARYTEQGVL